MEINLDGGEKEVLKAVGLSGSIGGRDLLVRVPGLDQAELISVLKGLLNCGYLLADKQAFHDFKDVENAEFRVNAGYAKDLKEALDPRLKKERDDKKSRRVRRE
jgi:hypothetical protein